MMRKSLKFCAEAGFACAGGYMARKAALGNPYALVPALLCAVAVGLSLWGRFRWGGIEFGPWLARLARIAREIAVTGAKFSALLSGLFYFTAGAALTQIGYMAFTSFLSDWGIVQVVSWCLLGGAMLCFFKAAADWAVAFKIPEILENKGVHGDAAKATQARAKVSARGTTERPPYADHGYVD